MMQLTQMECAIPGCGEVVSQFYAGFGLCVDCWQNAFSAPRDIAQNSADLAEYLFILADPNFWLPNVEFDEDGHLGERFAEAARAYVRETSGREYDTRFADFLVRTGWLDEDMHPIRAVIAAHAAGR